MAGWIGLSRFELGESDAAKADLEQATELNPRNRCRPSFNAIIRELAESEEHVQLVDLEAAAERAREQVVAFTLTIFYAIELKDHTVGTIILGMKWNS